MNQDKDPTSDSSDLMKKVEELERMVSESGAFEPALIVRLEVLVALLTMREETQVMEEVADVPKVRPGQVSPTPMEVSSPAQYDSRHISPSR